jgi:hypothetical protein
VDFFEDTVQATAKPKKRLVHRLEVKDREVAPEALQAYRDQIYANMYARTGLIFDVRSFRELKTIYNPVGGEIRIACVAPEIMVGPRGRKADLVPVAERDGCEILGLGTRTSLDDWRKRRLAELKVALEFEPHIICFSELCYPPPPSKDSPGWTVEGIQSSAVDKYKFDEDALRAIAAAIDPKPSAPLPFVFLGSYHCPMTLYNVGVIFPAGHRMVELRPQIQTDAFSRLEPQITYQKEKTLLPIYYRKRFPARRAGENTRVPATQQFDIFHLPIGRVATLICSDILDLNQFYKIAMSNYKTKEPIDIILVPSMNWSEKQISLCRELSHLANTTVVAANVSPTGGDRMPETQVFCCGLDAAQLAGMDEVVQHAIIASGVRDVVVDRKRSGKVHCFTLTKDGTSALRDRYPPPDVLGLEPENVTAADVGDLGD